MRDDVTSFAAALETAELPADTASAKAAAPSAPPQTAPDTPDTPAPPSPADRPAPEDRPDGSGTGDAADAGSPETAALAAQFRAPTADEQDRMVEAMLFASPEPLSIAAMAARMPPGSDPSEAVRRLEKAYENRGVVLRRSGDSWAFRTAPDLAFLMQREVTEQRKLSRAAIETLAIIAYHQPVTRAEIEEIRGVAVSRGTLDQLLELDWVRFGRRKMTPGRPVTFVVTEAFLDHFGLANVRDLPGLKELRAAGLLDSRGLPGGEPALPVTEPEPDADEASQPDPAQGEMFSE